MDDLVTITAVATLSATSVAVCTIFAVSMDRDPVDVGGASGVDVGGVSGVDVGGASGLDVGGASGIDVGGASGVDVGRASGVDVGGASDLVRDSCVIDVEGIVDTAVELV